jgi:hypothetical protein
MVAAALVGLYVTIVTSLLILGTCRGRFSPTEAVAAFLLLVLPALLPTAYLLIRMGREPLLVIHEDRLVVARGEEIEREVRLDEVDRVGLVIRRRRARIVLELKDGGSVELPFGSKRVLRELQRLLRTRKEEKIGAEAYRRAGADRVAKVLETMVERWRAPLLVEKEGEVRAVWPGRSLRVGEPGGWASRWLAWLLLVTPLPVVAAREAIKREDDSVRAVLLAEECAKGQLVRHSAERRLLPVIPAVAVILVIVKTGRLMVREAGLWSLARMFGAMVPWMVASVAAGNTVRYARVVEPGASFSLMLPGVVTAGAAGAIAAHGAVGWALLGSRLGLVEALVATALAPLGWVMLARLVRPVSVRRWALALRAAVPESHVLAALALSALVPAISLMILSECPGLWPHSLPAAALVEGLGVAAVARWIKTAERLCERAWAPD